MAGSIVDFLSLYKYWNNDALSQAEFINRLKGYLDTISQTLIEKESSVVQLSQQYEPTQAQWEQIWIAQTGKGLPIPPNAILLWYNTVSNTFGGQYGTSSGRSTVYRREPFYPKGAIIYQESSYLSTLVTNAIGLMGNRSNMPSLQFTIKKSFDLWLTFELTSTKSGAGYTVGGDFELNGEKVGTKYYGLPANYGLIHNTFYDRLPLRITVPIYNLPAGDYSVVAMFGFVGHVNSSAITSTIGGTAQGIRILTAQAVAR